MKTILVTGANGGIGLAIVQLFLANDFHVIAHYHCNKTNLEGIKNINLALLQADLSSQEEAKQLIENAFKISATIDILVNNAGTYMPTSSFEEQDLDILDQTLNINLKSPFLLSQHYIMHMKSQKHGKIINMSSIGVKYGGSTLAASYTISKAALEQMTVVMAKEAAKYNILMNVLRVGVVDTPFHQQKDLESRKNMIPLKRVAEPNEIAEYVYFLASDTNNFMTGSIMTVAGGE